MKPYQNRIVVKVGTSTLTNELGKSDLRCFDRLACVLSDIQNMGYEVILVSSGAIAVGRNKLKMKTQPTSMRHKQAAAAVGQCSYCAACGWKPRGTPSGFGVIIIGCFWWILWILGPFVRGASGGAAEEFLFPFVRRKSHKTKGNLIFLCKNHFSL